MGSRLAVTIVTSASFIRALLLPQKKIFRGQHRSWPQTEAQETDDIDQQRANEMQHMME
jgi:hypothetical protein